MILHTRMLCFYYFINPPLKIVSYTKTLSLQNIYCKIYLTTKVMGFGFGFFLFENARHWRQCSFKQPSLNSKY